MVTLLEPRTQTGRNTGNRECPGCPRCRDPEASLCTIPHPKFKNQHPVCKVCGHCVLRGKHLDNGADLDDHPGFGEGEGIGVPNQN